MDELDIRLTTGGGIAVDDYLRTSNDTIYAVGDVTGRDMHVYMAAHAGDRHGPPEEHRDRFPDGRVGSHSALATPDQGKALLAAAVGAVADDFAAFAAGLRDPDEAPV